MNIATLVLFALAWIIILYLVNVLIAKKWPVISVKPAATYVLTMALLGVCGEIFVGTLYQALFDRPLWQYRVFPIHNGFTSYCAPVIWGAVGFYSYLLHQTLRAKKFSENKLSQLFAAEALVLEFAVNLSFLLLFGVYLFYYLPSDLWHLTSIQTLPFYGLAGYALTRTVKRFQKDPVFFGLLCVVLLVLLLFMA